MRKTDYLVIVWEFYYFTLFVTENTGPLFYNGEFVAITLKIESFSKTEIVPLLS